jgi:beta-galactosidase
MRERSLFNNDWLFAADQLAIDASDALFEPVTLPHTNRLFPHSNFDNQDYQFISTYRKQFQLPLPKEGEQVFLDFDGVMAAGRVHLNDELISEHLGGFRPFSVELTHALLAGVNVLTVYVDSRERKDIPPYGHLVDYLTFGGIYRDVHLTRLPGTRIQKVNIISSNVQTTPSLSCQVKVNGFTPGLTLRAALIAPEGEEIAHAESVVSGETQDVTFKRLPAVDLWSLEQPALYSLRLTLARDGDDVDETTTRFGFREAVFLPDGRFMLNGKHIQLMGLNRHQTYPYIGAAAPARLQRLDAELLKHELGCNIVRTSHYLQSPHFLDRCDEVGLLVLEEIPGWQFIGDEDWKALTLRDVQAMIERDHGLSVARQCSLLGVPRSTLRGWLGSAHFVETPGERHGSKARG